MIRLKDLFHGFGTDKYIIVFSVFLKITYVAFSAMVGQRVLIQEL